VERRESLAHHGAALVAAAAIILVLIQIISDHVPAASAASASNMAAETSCMRPLRGYLHPRLQGAPLACVSTARTFGSCVECVADAFDHRYRSPPVAK
jgi:hypothetical protein